MLVQDPAHRIRPVILVLSKPELALFANDIEDLEREKNDLLAIHSSNQRMNRVIVGEVPLPRHKSDKDSQLRVLHDRC